MKHLKIMVKETNEERRALTREEYFAIWCCKYSDVANEFLKDSGYLNGSYEKPYLNCRIWCYGYGTFRTETIREATPNEERAYYILKCIGEKPCYGCIENRNHPNEKCCPLEDEKEFDYEYVRKKAKQLLAGKEVYPELVEE